MTLIELLVSLAVLAVISIAFATILSQSQQVTTRSNALMQANATASAIAQVLRRDLASFCPRGFLAVYDPDPGDPSSHLVFTAVGPFTSVTLTDPNDPNYHANAARIDYGLDPSGNLWRRAVLLTGTSTGVADPSTDDDVDPNAWLGRYEPNYPAAITVDGTLLDTYCQAPVIPAVVKDPSDVDKLWPLLGRPAGTFRVSWWDDTDKAWKDPSASTGVISPPPQAIRVRFSLTTGPKPSDKIDYEVICPVRQ